MDKSEARLGLDIRTKDDHSMRGTIICLTSRHGANFVVVELDNGDACPIDLVELEPIPERNTALEQEFEKLVDTVGEQIQAYVKVAEEAIRLAIQLADQHGIPFYAPVSILGQPYVPESFIIKWHDLDDTFVSDLTEVGASDLKQAYGWSSSSEC